MTKIDLPPILQKKKKKVLDVDSIKRIGLLTRCLAQPIEVGADLLVEFIFQIEFLTNLDESSVEHFSFC